MACSVKLMISGIFYLIFWHHSSPWVTEAKGSETVKRGLLYLQIHLSKSYPPFKTYFYLFHGSLPDWSIHSSLSVLQKSYVSITFCISVCLQRQWQWIFLNTCVSHYTSQSTLHSKFSINTVANFQRLVCVIHIIRSQ